MKSNLNITLLAGTLAFSLNANAGQVFMDVGTNFNLTDGDSLTNPVDNLGYTGTVATSFWYGFSDGDVVRDTNIASVLTSLGFSAGSYTAIDGSTPVTFLDPASQNSYFNFDAINPLTGGPATENYGVDWMLTYEYDFTGEVISGGTDVLFNSGFINIFYNDYNFSTDTLSSQQQVLQLLVTSSITAPNNLTILGDVTFDWYTPGSSAFVENFFNDVEKNQSFYDIWEAGTNKSIAFDLVTNVSPPVPSDDQLVDFDISDATSPLVRQSQLNGQVRFNVPEPETLALIGIGLVGLGFKRKATA